MNRDGNIIFVERVGKADRYLGMLVDEGFYQLFFAVMCNLQCGQRISKARRKSRGKIFSGERPFSLGRN